MFSNALRSLFVVGACTYICVFGSANANTIYATDYTTGTIKAVASDGTVSVFATTGLYDTLQGLTMDGHGNLYVAHMFGYHNVGISKITPSGVVSAYAPHISGGVTGLACTDDGYVYASSHGSGIINKVSPTGEVSVFASGMERLQGLALDRLGNLYAASYSVDGVDTISSIFKIAPNGDKSVFATGVGLSGPVQIAFNSQGILFVANHFSGIVSKIGSDGVVHQFSAVSRPSSLTGLAIDANDNVYTSWSGHIGKFNSDGTQSVVTSTGLLGAHYIAINSAAPIPNPSAALAGISLLTASSMFRRVR